MIQNVITQWRRWSILVLVFALSGCGPEVVAPTPEQIAAQYNITQDQLNQWNANNDVNTNPATTADLTIVGCTS